MNKIAEKYLKRMKKIKQRNDEFIYIFKDNNDKNINEENLNLSFYVHAGELPDNFIYKKINEGLRIITETNLEDSEDQIYKYLIKNIESDIYITDLTVWLNSSPNRIQYIDEVLENHRPTDGFILLSSAQSLETEKIYQRIFSYIKEEKEEEI